MWGRYRRWPRLVPVILAAASLVLLGWLAYRSPPAGGSSLAEFSRTLAVAREGSCEVLAVIDGDTLVVRQAANGTAPEFVGKIRLLGINTPETVKRGEAPQPFGAEATAFTKDKIAAGKVRLELDKRRVDRYGRFLAYVYVGNRHLNEELITAGLARVHTYPGDSMTINRQLLRAQDKARREKRGIWQQPSIAVKLTSED